MSLNRNPRAPGRPHVDLSGLRFGRWTALRRSDYPTRTLVTLWLCRCDCGAESMVRLTDLRSARSRSCGCLRRELGAMAVVSRARRGDGKFVCA